MFHEPLLLAGKPRKYPNHYLYYIKPWREYEENYVSTGDDFGGYTQIVETYGVTRKSYDKATIIKEYSSQPNIYSFFCTRKVDRSVTVYSRQCLLNTSPRYEGNFYINDYFFNKNWANPGGPSSANVNLYNILREAYLNDEFVEVYIEKP